LNINMLYSFLRFSSGLRSAVLVLLTAGLLGACSAPEGLDEEETARLEKRVAERWQTKIDRDFGATWEFATPEYRKNFPRDLYVQKFSYAVEWELTGVAAAVASVAARVMSKPTKLTSEASRAIGAVPRTIREKWILVDGQWWYSANY
jgi:hypothetical protein